MTADVLIERFIFLFLNESGDSFMDRFVTRASVPDWSPLLHLLGQNLSEQTDSIVTILLLHGSTL